MDTVKNPAVAEASIDYEYVKRKEKRIQYDNNHFRAGNYDCNVNRNTSACAC